MNGAEVRDRIVARLCRVHAPRHLLLAGAQDEALCRSLAQAAMDHGAILHVATKHVPAWLSAIRSLAGDRCILHQASAVDVVGVMPVPDLAWIDGDANWFTVHGLLQALHTRAGVLERPFPLTLVAGAGWPNARRDSYADPASIPAVHLHSHERAGLSPGRAAPGGGGLYAERFHAVGENEPGNGVLTAVEDFLAGRASELRLTLLPGFGGLAAIASRGGPAADAFAPAGVAQDMTLMAEALETARLAQQVRLAEDGAALRQARDLVDKLRATAGTATAAEPGVSTPRAAMVALSASILPFKRRLAALLPGRAEGGGPDDESRQQAAVARLAASPIFDAAWYKATYGDVAEAGTEPALHYLRDGAGELRDPGPYFSTGYYLAAYPDVAAEKLNPLLHYLASGAAEGRNPGVHFATRHYVEAHPEVGESGVNPLEHYLTVGRAAGWVAPAVGG